MEYNDALPLRKKNVVVVVVVIVWVSLAGTALPASLILNAADKC